MRKILAYLMLAAFGILGTVNIGFSQNQENPKPWMSGWIAGKFDDDKMIAAAKALRFNALVLGGTPERMQEFAVKARKDGIDTYWWLGPKTPKDQDKSLFMQVMPEKDRLLLEKLKADNDWKKVYQYGGEPLPGHDEVCKNPIPCFHRSEVLDAIKGEIREMLEKCPALTGVAFDDFGYQNYSNCVCGESLRQLGEFRKKNPGLSEKAAEKEFSLSSLVGCINELANFARSLRPGIKTTIHIWPSYMPEPLYGNRLDLDYCAQTVAWFFPPYWADDKIAKYTRTVVGEDKKYFKRSKGIPFVGIYLGKKFTVDKPLDQFKRELKVVFENSPDTSLSVHEFADIATNPEYYKELTYDKN